VSPHVFEGKRPHTGDFPSKTAGGAVGRADLLRRGVTERLEELVGGLAADADPGDVYVGWVAAADAAGCPARFRASGVDGWGFPGWSPALAAGAVGRVALARHLDRHVTAVAASNPALPHPLAAVKTWMKEARETPTSPVAEWVTQLTRQGDRAALAVTASLATRWIAGFVRVLGWPLPEGLVLVVDDPGSPSARRGTPAFRPRLSSTRRVAIAVASKPDAMVGTVAPSGRFDVLFHRANSSDDLTLAERAAFEATAASLAIGIVPRAVVLTVADTGERLRFPVADDLLERGADLAVDVVRQRLRASEVAGDEYGDAVPSSACRYCSERETCPPGVAWLIRPGRRHNGLPVLTS